MTREELKRHCEKQIEMCEFWAISKDEKVYEEHKLILELLEQESVLDEIRTKIEEAQTYDGIYIDRSYVLQIIDKYKKES